MIRSFGNQTAADMFLEKTTRAAVCLPRNLWRVAQRKLKALDVALRLDDLSVPAGNHLEPLRGDRQRRFSIRINDQYCVTFRWENGHAHEVRIEDYH